MTALMSPVETIDPQLMRSVMGMVPTSVAVVAGESFDGRAAMVVGSFVSVSLEPALVGFFVGHTSTSWPKLREADVLGISALASGQGELCRKLGKKETDRFSDRYWSAGLFGAPLVQDAVARIECRIESVSAAGDHDFVLAQVLTLDEGPVTDPLVFQNRGFSGLAGI